MVGVFQSTLPVRGATSGLAATGVNQVFQSTLPVRGATGGNLTVYGYALISIHAPREGSDLHLQAPSYAQFRFQSTLPVRGATYSRMGANCRR